MKFRCKNCNEDIEHDAVVKHAAEHIDVLKREAHAAIANLPAQERVQVISRYCSVCGWALQDDYICRNEIHGDQGVTRIKR